jgi:hypothetical protein
MIEDLRVIIFRHLALAHSLPRFHSTSSHYIGASPEYRIPRFHSTSSHCIGASRILKSLLRVHWHDHLQTSRVDLHVENFFRFHGFAVDVKRHRPFKFYLQMLSLYHFDEA